ncbi:MAG: hypothetical protein ACK4UJ_01320 [Leptonema sp. (in: bacteria)]
MKVSQIKNGLIPTKNFWKNLKKENKILKHSKKIHIPISIKKGSITVCIEYFFKNKNLFYKISIHDPFLLLDTHTKNILESSSSIFLLNTD